MFSPKKTLIPILNGLIGDRLADRAHSLAIPLAFRLNGEDIECEKVPFRKKFASATLLIHGLMADDRIWHPFSSKLVRHTNVYSIRYNTGRHISTNGRLLAEKVHELDLRYGFRSYFLMGHSMGGLVTRSACYYAQKEGFPWVKRLKVVCLIAVPNAGAGLEKVGHLTSFALRRLAGWHLGIVGNLIEQRSDGIKDLRLGSMVDEDWQSPKNRIKDHFKRTPVPPIAGVHYHIVVGTLSKDEKSLLGTYFGDGLVSQKSAVAKTLLKVSTVKVFPRTGHNALLKSRAVHRYLISQLKPFR